MNRLTVNVEIVEIPERVFTRNSDAKTQYRWVKVLVPKKDNTYLELSAMCNEKNFNHNISVGSIVMGEFIKKDDDTYILNLAPFKKGQEVITEDMLSEFELSNNHFKIQTIGSGS